MADIIQTGIEAARSAGEYLLGHFGKEQTVHVKGDRNLVTDVDRGAQDMIIGHIARHFPRHGIIAEEGGSVREQAEYIWIIDPLDGTHNYIRGVAVFGVSIGIVRNGSYVGGIIYMPFAGELYVAEKDHGAYKNDTKISVSSNSALADCSVSFDSGLRHAPARMLPVLGSFADRAFNVRMFGSSARALSYLAEGKIDVSVEFEDQPWDCAAGICLIEQAGGKVTDLSGNPMAHTTIGYVATNGAVHEAALGIVRAHG
ncbi:MAG: inositol monophosphatase [Candidatus Omnitrophica bacterium]|nr:inositol monophosphatase [Candidatus Omnitrophota bacterium]